MNSAIVDSNVIIAEYDASDSLHKRALALRKTLKFFSIELLYLDCVMNEVFSVMARRMIERRKTTEIKNLLLEINSDFPSNIITESYAIVNTLYPDIVSKMIETNGKLNFHVLEILSLEFTTRFKKLGLINQAPTKNRILLC